MNTEGLLQQLAAQPAAHVVPVAIVTVPWKYVLPKYALNRR